MHEARHWHRLAYGGFGEAQTLSPHELGYAAAYEAYRTWIDNSSIYEPISADRARQREALIGLSIAEVTRLWRYLNRVPDRYARMEACEAAAATGSVLFSVSVDEEYANMPHHSRHRSTSFSGGSYPVESYRYDDERIQPRHRSHRHRRNSSASSMGLPPMQSGPSPYYGTTTLNPTGIPGTTGSAYGFPTTGSYSGSGYNDGRVSPSPYNVPGSSYGAPGTSPYHVAGTSPYNFNAVGTPYNTAGSIYSNQIPYQQPVMTTGSYTQPAQYGTSPGAVSIPPGSTLVIEQPTYRTSSHRHRHHKHGSGHRHRRHRSSSDASYSTAPVYTTTAYHY